MSLSWFCFFGAAVLTIALIMMSVAMLEVPGNEKSTISLGEVTRVR